MPDSVKEIVEGYDPKLSLAESSTPPAPWYTDSRIFRLELSSVFFKSWQIVGRTDQLSAPGQFVTSNIGGETILTVASHDGIRRGFYNVCRHHAAVVVTQNSGSSANFRCPYHGWTYDLEGKLILTPEFAGVANFDRAANGLVPVQIAVWKNWVFARPESGDPSLEQFLGSDLLKRFQALNLERLHWFERRVYTLNCNWKVFVDNYLDGGYHVPHIHGGLNSVLDHGSYTIETGRRYCLQSSPLVGQNVDAPTATVRKGRKADYYWVYPNFMINIYDTVMDTNLVVPRDAAHTDVVFDYYFTDVSVHAREQNRASIAVSEQIQAEDRLICESVQRGLNSRSYDAGRLSVRREAGEHLFHRLLAADLGAGLSEEK